jgi:putrescine aminotransferase
VGEVRSLGLIGAVEIVRQKGTNLRFGDKEGPAGTAVRDRCVANGLMLRAVRDSIIMSPPLIITEAEIDRLVSTLRQVADRGGIAVEVVAADGCRSA